MSNLGISLKYSTLRLIPTTRQGSIGMGRMFKACNGALARVRAQFGTNAATLKVNYWWLIVLSAVLHRVPFALGDSTTLVDLKRASLVLSYVVLVWALFRNFHLFGVRVLAVGALLNFAAILANGGLMPVSPEARQAAHMTLLDSSHLGGILPEGSGVLLPLQSTNLPLLTDIIPASWLHGVLSIGDVIIGVGMVLLLISAAMRMTKQLRSEGSERRRREEVPIEG